MESIAAEVFLHQTQLRFLYLSKNDIQHIEATAFKGLVNLKRLFLNNNKINDSSLMSLDLLPSLQWL